MAKPQVTLTLAGDESKLTQSFMRVGESSRAMASSVGESSRVVAEESAAGFDRAAEGADNAEGRAQGFSDTLTGTKDLMSATGEIARGNYFEGLVMAGQGAADLAGGLATFVIPAVKNMSLSMISNAASAVRSTAAMAANKVGMLAGAAATNVMAFAQRGLNLALRANPIGLVITAIALLVAGIVIAYKRSETFRSIVQGAMRGVQTAFGWVVTKGGELIGWFRTLPGKIGGFFAGIGTLITRPFRAAFDGIRSAWNNTIGGKGFSFPGIAGHGAFSFRVPMFHTGGIVSGAMGSETLAVLRAGERVTAGSNSGAGVTIVLKSDGTSAGRALIEVLKKAIKVEAGGNVVVALSS